MTGCPSYLELIVFESSADPQSLDQNSNSRPPLVHYDLVVFCPPVFRVSVLIRPRDTSTMTSSSFIVRLVDVVGRSIDFRLTRLSRSSDDSSTGAAAAWMRPRQRMQSSSGQAGTVAAPAGTSASVTAVTTTMTVIGITAASVVVYYVGTEIIVVLKSRGKQSGDLFLFSFTLNKSRF